MPRQTSLGARLKTSIVPVYPVTFFTACLTFAKTLRALVPMLELAINARRIPVNRLIFKFRY